MATETDDFNRADHGNLGVNWTAIDAGWSISGNKALSATSLESVATWDAAVTNFTDNQSSEATVGGIGANEYVGVLVRGQASSGPGTFYVYFSDSVSAYIQKYVNGTAAGLQSGLAAAVNGDVLKISVEGTTLRAYKNGSQQGTDEDISASPITGGQPGLYAYSTLQTATTDNWTGADITAGGGGGTTNNLLLLMGVG